MYIICNNTEFFTLLEKHPVFFSTFIGLLTLITGVVAILIGIENYVKKTQKEAQSGFYVNFLIYLERLGIILNDYPQILQLLFDEATREKFPIQMPLERSKIVAPLFSDLCTSFLEYLSTATNNVPPTSCKPTDNAWVNWYENILRLTRFLHKGTIVGKLYIYTSEEQIDDYNKEYLAVSQLIINISNELKARLNLSS